MLRHVLGFVTRIWDPTPKDYAGNLIRLRPKTEAEAIGLKEQSPNGLGLARRALRFQREAKAVTLLRLKIEFAHRILKHWAAWCAAVRVGDFL